MPEASLQMQVTIQQAKKLLTESQAFTQLGFSMMLTRMKTLYEKNPSQETLQTCTAEINTFLEKFRVLMIVDYEIIKQL
jgi:hypothetical protein